MGIVIKLMGKIRQATRKVSKGEPKSTGNPFKDFSRKAKCYSGKAGGSPAVKKAAGAVKDVSRKVTNSSAAKRYRQMASAVYKAFSL